MKIIDLEFEVTSTQTIKAKVRVDNDFVDSHSNIEALAHALAGNKTTFYTNQGNTSFEEIVSHGQGPDEEITVSFWDVEEEEEEEKDEENQVAILPLPLFVEK